MTPKIVAIAGSTRRSSLHKELARAAVDEAARAGFDATFVDLAELPLPLYDGDLEAASGVPEAAHRLYELLADTDVVLFASPEYNGGYTAVLKNAIDWVTRIDRSVFARPTLLISASSGKGGGAKGLGLLRKTLEHMAVPVVSELSLPNAGPGVGSHPAVRHQLRALVADAAESSAGLQRAS